ncbi:MAG TPA: glycosyltransferase family 39 protein [Bacteroidales bacterium]|nr:glycosyltransferase family 39 protein [Bacteroidales bacterium]
MNPKKLLIQLNEQIDRRTGNYSDKKKLTTAIAIITLFSIIAGGISALLMYNSMYDQDGFAALGRQFAQYNNFGGNVERGPIYPFFIGIFTKLFGFSNVLFVFLHSLLVALLGILSFFISKNIYKSWKVATLTGMLVAIHPMILLYIPKFLIEVLYAPLVLIMIWRAYKALTLPNFKNLALFGFFTGVASLCKAVTFVFPLFFAGSVLILYFIKIEVFRTVKPVTLLKLFVIPFFFTLLTISPWTIRNYKVTKTFILVSRGAGYQYLRGKYIADENAFLLVKTNEQIWRKFDVGFNEIKRKCNIDTTEYVDSDIVSQPLVMHDTLDFIMKNHIKTQPLSFVVRTLKQIPTFWIRGENIKKSLGFIALSFSTIFLFIVGFVKLNRRDPFSYIVLITVLYFNLMYAAILAIARYSMPVYAPLMIIGTWGLYFIYQKYVRKEPVA